MIENLNKGLTDLQTSKPAPWPALQVNGVSARALGTPPGRQGQPLQAAGYAGGQVQQTLGARQREKSPSFKRSAGEAQLQEGDRQADQDVPWSQVLGRNQGRKPRIVQYGTAKVNVAGAEAKPYDVVIGNTNPGSTDKIIKEVQELMEAEYGPEAGEYKSQISLESTCNVQRPILLDGLPGNTSHQGSKDQQFQHSIQAQQHSHLKRGQILITKYGF